MQAYKCDRCNKLEAGLPLIDISAMELQKGKTFEPLELELQHDIKGNIHLCLECKTAFIEFLKGGKREV